MGSFHAWVCFLEQSACLGTFIYSFFSSNKIDFLWLYSIIGLFTIPLVNELVLTIKGKMFRDRVLTPNFSERHNLENCSPIVYSPTYNISFFGLEKIHPFDAAKYRRVMEDLQESAFFNPSRDRIHRPEVPPREFLQNVMSPCGQIFLE